jgi:acyl CoA:acetate/3-ketoacid CoA transferase beta subunit
VITDLGEFTVDRKGGGVVLTGLAPGVTVEEIRAKTEAAFEVDLAKA